MNYLSVLEQNPHQGWAELIGGIDVANDAESVNDHALEPETADDELTAFRL